MAENNMTVVREALKLCGSRMCRLCKELELARSMLNKRPLGVFCHPDKCTAYQAAHAALALPRLNCEVGTAEEQEVRFRNYCWNHSSKDKNMECQCPIDAEGKAGCKLEWAQMPYESEKGEVDDSNG